MCYDKFSRLTQGWSEYVILVRLAPPAQPARRSDQPGRGNNGCHHGQGGRHGQQRPQERTRRHNHVAHPASHMAGIIGKGRSAEERFRLMT
ncbi:hypothetical protein NPIL_548871 [Nephila pilipes]|uniref:Uncharacterized protein n=1 Tax=Nephila pilipes TaxID=299642 RepID=A0A8X6ULS0_NEPPI|nr:hypothetical protein NPIL_548871 [Nephila pilipes]